MGKMNVQVLIKHSKANFEHVFFWLGQTEKANPCITLNITQKEKQRKKLEETG